LPVPRCSHKVEHTMFSAWCQSKLLTADWFFIELSGDAEFKASISGRLWPN